MSTVDPDRARTIFADAVELAPADRAAFLNQACGPDAALRAEVESLLAADEQAGQFLPAKTVVGEHAPGDTIGSYTLLEVIGEGGFGHVWRARQSFPIHREVALKLLKPEIASHQVLKRFEAEREAIAIMDHPGIAKIFDAGATSTSRPYFVMELVRGIPLTQYCDGAKLDLTHRLELFVHICLAVQHAHGKGIIHRDLKPGNVLVTEVDGRPVPKIIDFGVAKAAATQDAQKQFFTEFRQLLGTPEYMSPEQASMVSRDIDTRSDIYSLGVILYELLVGVTPLDAQSLREAAYAEMQRIIREVDPPRPSTRISQLTETVASISAVRNLEPSSLRRQLRGELDWIVMKCLEKQQSRRYSTAAALAEDLQRHLEGRAVSAAPPSTLYTFGKFVKRHRFASALTIAVAAALLLGLLGITYQYVQTRRARDLAIRNQQAADAQRREADRQRATAQAVGNFLTEMLTSADPEESGAREITVREIADRAAAELERRPMDQPVIDATIRTTLADTNLGLGRYEVAARLARQSREVLERELGPDHLETLKAQNNLAVALAHLNQLDEAMRLHQDVLARKQRLGLADDADTLLTINNLGYVLISQGKSVQAEAFYRRAYEGRTRLLGPDDPLTLASGNALASALLWNGKFDESESLGREILARRRRLLGEDHPATARTLTALAGTLFRKRDFAAAEPLLRQASDVMGRVLGPDHPDTIDALRMLGDALRQMQRLDEAEPILREVRLRSERVLGRDHPDTIRSLSSLVALMIDQKRVAEAVTLAREVLDRALRAFGPDHPDTISLRAALANALRLNGQLPEAQQQSRQVLADRIRVLGEQHPVTINAMTSLADVLIAAGKHDEGATLYRQAYELALRASASQQQVRIAIGFGKQLIALNRWNDAEPILQKAVELSRSANDPMALITANELLVQTARGAGNAPLAAERERQLQSLRAATQPTTRP